MLVLFSGLAIAVAALIFAVQMRPKARVRRMFIRIKRSTVSPLSTYFDEFFHFFPTQSAYDAFHAFVKEAEYVLEVREADVSRVLEVVQHLLRVWPGAVVSYNAWYTLHHAQRHEMLDEHFMPVPNAEYVDEQAARFKQLCESGGLLAAATYFRLGGR